MADFEVHKIPKGTQPWFAQYHTFVEALEQYCSEIEVARSSYSTLNDRISSIGGGGGGGSHQIGDVLFSLQAPADAFYWGVVTPPGITLDIATYPDLYAVYSASSASSDWIPKTAASSANFYAVTWNGTNYIAVGGNIQYSANGDTWSDASNEPSGVIMNGVAAGGGTVVAVGDNNSIAYSTNNGAAWLSTTSSLTGSAWSYQDVGYDGSKFVAIAVNMSTLQTAVCTSTNGQTGWATQSTINSFIGRALTAKSGPIYVIGGQDPTGANRGLVYRSANLITWTSVLAGAYIVYGAGVAFNYLILVGESGLIIYSLDGINWQQFTPPGAITLNFVGVDTSQGLAYVGGEPTNSGSQATVYTWDGTLGGTWVAEYVGAGSYLQSIATNGVDNVVVGTDSDIFKRAGVVGDITVWTDETAWAFPVAANDTTTVLATSTGRLLAAWVDDSGGDYNTGYVYYSDDDGATWNGGTISGDTAHANVGPFLDLYQAPDDKVWLLRYTTGWPGVSGLALWSSTDNGITYGNGYVHTGIDAALGTGDGLVGFTYDVDNSRYACMINIAGGNTQKVYTSPSGATGTWTLRSTLSLGGSNGFGRVNALVYHSGTGNLIMSLINVSGGSDNIKYSTDGGVTWLTPTGIYTGTVTYTSVDIHPITGTIIANHYNNITDSYWRSTDGGVSFTEHTYAGTTGLSTLANAYRAHPGPNNTWMIVEGAVAGNEFYISIDDGLTWTAETATTSIFDESPGSTSRMTSAYNGTVWAHTSASDGAIYVASYGQALAPTTFFLPYMDTPTNINSVWNMYVKVL